jgi:hypothetical protein
VKRTWPAATALIGLLIPCQLYAQTGPVPPLARGDAAALLGWHNSNKGELSNQYGDDWYNRSLFAGGLAGWYWTDHHKTEVEVSLTTRDELNVYSFVIIQGQQLPAPSRYSFDTRRTAITQQYQFFRNAWFHPFIAVGIDLRWETVRREDLPFYAYDPQTRQSRLVQNRRVQPEKTSLDARPLALIGFKTYMTRRAFFRSDLRLGIHPGLEDATLRFGVGIDF